MPDARAPGFDSPPRGVSPITASVDHQTADEETDVPHDAAQSAVEDIDADTNFAKVSVQRTFDLWKRASQNDSDILEQLSPGPSSAIADSRDSAPAHLHMLSGGKYGNFTSHRLGSAGRGKGHGRSTSTSNHDMGLVNDDASLRDRIGSTPEGRQSRAEGRNLRPGEPQYDEIMDRLHESTNSYSEARVFGPQAFDTEIELRKHTLIGPFASKHMFEYRFGREHGTREWEKAHHGSAPMIYPRAFAFKNILTSTLDRLFSQPAASNDATDRFAKGAVSQTTHEQRVALAVQRLASGDALPAASASRARSGPSSADHVHTSTDFPLERPDSHASSIDASDAALKPVPPDRRGMPPWASPPSPDESVYPGSPGSSDAPPFTPAQLRYHDVAEANITTESEPEYVPTPSENESVDAPTPTAAPDQNSQSLAVEQPETKPSLADNQTSPFLNAAAQQLRQQASSSSDANDGSAPPEPVLPSNGDSSSSDPPPSVTSRTVLARLELQLGQLIDSVRQEHDQAETFRTNVNAQLTSLCSDSRGQSIKLSTLIAENVSDLQQLKADLTAVRSRVDALPPPDDSQQALVASVKALELRLDGQRTEILADSQDIKNELALLRSSATETEALVSAASQTALDMNAKLDAELASLRSGMYSVDDFAKAEIQTAQSIKAIQASLQSLVESDAPAIDTTQAFSPSVESPPPHFVSNSPAATPSVSATPPVTERLPKKNNDSMQASLARDRAVTQEVVIGQATLAATAADASARVEADKAAQIAADAESAAQEAARIAAQHREKIDQLQAKRDDLAASRSKKAHALESRRLEHKSAVATLEAEEMAHQASLEKTRIALEARRSSIENTENHISAIESELQESADLLAENSRLLSDAECETPVAPGLPPDIPSPGPSAQLDPPSDGSPSSSSSEPDSHSSVDPDTGCFIVTSEITKSYVKQDIGITFATIRGKKANKWSLEIGHIQSRSPASKIPMLQPGCILLAINEIPCKDRSSTIEILKNCTGTFTITYRRLRASN